MQAPVMLHPHLYISCMLAHLWTSTHVLSNNNKTPSSSRSKNRQGRQYSWLSHRQMIDLFLQSVGGALCLAASSCTAGYVTLWCAPVWCSGVKRTWVLWHISTRKTAAVMSLDMDFLSCIRKASSFIVLAGNQHMQTSVVCFVQRDFLGAVSVRTCCSPGTVIKASRNLQCMCIFLAQEISGNLFYLADHWFEITHFLTIWKCLTFS